MRVVIADDEPLARRGICQLLADHAHTRVVAECSNGIEAVEAITSCEADLVFLDVQMPELDGFEVLRHVGAERMPSVVFVTAYDALALRAFDVAAVDYLMKPVGPERFAAAMQRVHARGSESAAMRRVKELQALLAQTAPTTTPLIVTTGKRTFRIDPADIDWISAEDCYAVLHIGAKRYLLRESLTSLETRLRRSNFVRVHRSAIINCKCVRELRADSMLLHDGTRVSISRRRSAAVNAVLRSARPK